MSHVRAQIRAAAAATLAGLPTSGTRVHVNRMRPIAAEDCPALVVFLGGEESSIRDYGRTVALDRDFSLHIQCKASGTTADDTLDQLTAEVEAAFMATPEAFTLGGLVKRGLFLSAVSDPEIDDETSPKVAAQTLTFKGRYRTLANDPTTPII